MHSDRDDFRKRIGFDQLPGADAPSGVVLDWTALPDVLQPSMAGGRLEFNGVAVLTAGMSLGRWSWNEGDRHLLVHAYVSGRGIRGAREQFLEKASTTMMKTIPYEVGPRGLGDLAVQLPALPDRTVHWVCRNVYVWIRSEEGGPPVQPVARQLQDWMASHVVPRLADYLPKVDRVEPPASRIRVGQIAEVHVRLAAGVARESLLAESREINGSYLDPGADDGLNALYTGRTPGDATIEVRITDPKTLLSPPLPPLTVTVLPALTP